MDKEQLFKNYKNERSIAYINLYRKLLIFIFILIFINMILLCILYLSAWFLFMLIPLTILLYFINKMSVSNEQLINKITSDNYQDYLHNGGLFYMSFAQYILEEKCINSD